MNLKLGEKMDEKMLSSVIFQLIHTLSHMMLNAGKSIIGLDVDSISEYIFPSSFSYAIYVSKIQGGGMGNLIAAFENDLNRWINASFEHAQLCLYDPVCKDHKAACHACSYLKFSCQHFNRGLSRTLLIGGIIEGKQIIGFLDSKVNN
ncbi:Zn-binding domain-containing protein [Exiguobacterium sp. JMULE1]|nr:Zn-binding domain-containing protein [Exiguobacterium sp. JMULE1]